MFRCLLTVEEVSAEEAEQVEKLLSLIRSQIEHTCTQVSNSHLHH